MGGSLWALRLAARGTPRPGQAGPGGRQEPQEPAGPWVAVLASQATENAKDTLAGCVSFA